MSENALGAAEWNSLLSSPILHGLPLSPKQMASSTKCSHICLPSVQVRLDLAERFELWGLVFERHELRHPRSTSSEVPGKAGRHFFHKIQSFFTVSLPTLRNRVRGHGWKNCDATRRLCRGRHTILQHARLYTIVKSIVHNTPSQNITLLLTHHTTILPEQK